jgi:hypothetical protein
VDHPRWSQATERRIGEFRRRKTLPFNGYGDQVASLYAGMDLKMLYLVGGGLAGPPRDLPPQKRAGATPALGKGHRRP